MADDLVAGRICQDTLEAVANLDPQLVILFRDHKEDPIISSFLPELVFLRNPKRIVLDALPAQGGDHDDCDLVGGFTFEIGQRRFEPAQVVSGKSAGKVGHPLMNFGNGQLTALSAYRSRQEEEAREEQRGKPGCCVGQNLTFGAFSAPGSAWKKAFSWKPIMPAINEAGIVRLLTLYS